MHDTTSWRCFCPRASLPDDVRNASAALRALRDHTGDERLAQPSVGADEELAWKPVAMSVRSLGALACYDVASGDLGVIVAIDEISSPPR